MNTETCVFESASFDLFLTFRWDSFSGSVSVTFSARSHTPQPAAATLRVLTVWQSWVNAIDQNGVIPPLPKGWRLKDGAREGATSGTPDHLH